MPASKAQRAATAERRGKAIALRLAGMDYDNIAQRLGYADRAAACKDIQRALEANVAQQTQSADTLREVELMRLDRLQAAAWQAAAQGNLKAIETVLKVVDRRCRLLGLDAPIKADISVSDALTSEIERLAAQLGVAEPTPAEESSEWTTQA